MVVHPDYPGLTVEIIADGEPLVEHIDQSLEENAKEVIRYVQVNKEGKFHVRFRLSPEKAAALTGLNFELRLDGQFIQSSVYYKNLHKETFEITQKRHLVHGIQHSSDFIFSSFNIGRDARERKIVVSGTDQQAEKDGGGQPSETMINKMKNTGVITVLFHHIRNVRIKQSHGKFKSAKLPEPSVFEQVPEKSMQVLGLSHHTRLGNAKKCVPWKAATFDYVDGREDKDALAIFHFKYRSLDVLKALHIIPETQEPVSLSPQASVEPLLISPLTPSPSSTAIAQHSNQKDDDNELSAEEMLALLKYYRGGNEAGLYTMPRQEMTVLLNMYREKNRKPPHTTTPNTTEIKPKHSSNETDGNRAKRGRGENEAVTGPQKCTRLSEQVIVLNN